MWPQLCGCGMVCGWLQDRWLDENLVRALYRPAICVALALGAVGVGYFLLKFSYVTKHHKFLLLLSLCNPQKHSQLDLLSM